MIAKIDSLDPKMAFFSSDDGEVFVQIIKNRWVAMERPVKINVEEDWLGRG